MMTNEPDVPPPPADGTTGDGDDHLSRAKVRKAPNAFRTISEVADDLHIPQHVLRFWETRFPQVKPMKRGGGRRYYRPDDIALLRRIANLLYTQGYTIKGVQRLLREGGGRLSEDIPPAPAEESSSPDPDDMPPHGEPEPPPEPEPFVPVAATPSSPRPRPRQPDAERLRAVLAETLAELEALRDLLH